MGGSLFEILVWNERLAINKIIDFKASYFKMN